MKSLKYAKLATRHWSTFSLGNNVLDVVLDFLNIYMTHKTFVACNKDTRLPRSDFLLPTIAPFPDLYLHSLICVILWNPSLYIYIYIVLILYIYKILIYIVSLTQLWWLLVPTCWSRNTEVWGIFLFTRIWGRTYSWLVMEKELLFPHRAGL